MARNFPNGKFMDMILAKGESHLHSVLAARPYVVRFSSGAWVLRLVQPDRENGNI